MIRRLSKNGVRRLAGFLLALLCGATLTALPVAPAGADTAAQEPGSVPVKLQRLEYRLVGEAAWTAATGLLPVPVGSEVEFRAVAAQAAGQAAPDAPADGDGSGEDVSWAGSAGGVGTGHGVRVHFTAASASVKDFRTVIAQSANQLTVKVLVVRLEKLQYRVDVPGRADDKAPMQDVPAGPLSVAVGGTVLFKAVISPHGAAPPPGLPLWGGTATLAKKSLSNEHGLPEGSPAKSRPW